MASFKIPERYYQAVRELVSLNETQTIQLTEVFRELPVYLSLKKIISTVSPRLESIGLVHGEDIFAFIASLHSLLQKVDADISIQKVVDDIVDAIDEAISPDLKGETREVFAMRLVTLLEASKALNIAAKAVGVITEHEHVFLESRILTDIRVIFNNLEEEPTEAVIVHNLKITYRQEGKKKEFFIVLDNSDLLELTKQITRAEAKVKAIEKILERAEVNHISPE